MNTETYYPPSTEGARQWIRDGIRIWHISLNRISLRLGIPVGTLSRFADGGKLPHKHKHKLGIYYDRKLIDMPVNELRWALENRYADNDR